MPEVKIYGASDDLVEVEEMSGTLKNNEGEYDYRMGKVWRADLVAPSGEQMRVHCFYDGCWHTSLGQVDEDVPLPVGWLTGYEVERKYSTALHLTVPEGTRITNVGYYSFNN